ncbi:MAG TPA: threonine aldolase family protein, partial [Candidatus Polarisedimenticolia bacterium]|nr:threonine aldolase family protein [Candidatus Polarisedimenticolia bacterium]
MIDLRSDTVTQPTAAMRRAMAEAEVGDDVYGEDPTVNRLERLAADLVGMEAALFVPSGTMGNQIAIAVHARPGTEIVCEARAHVIEYELASMAVISGCMPRPVAAPDGILTAELAERALRAELPGLTRPGALLVENTHNLWSGAVTPVAELRRIARLAAQRRIPLHMDGARVFNAALASGVEAREVVRGFDSVMFCLSKGLCAPVGSLLAGRGDFVARARRWRKRLGGGMRQAGVLAAAGLVALETMRDRLAEDHETAAELARGLSELPGIALDTPGLLTNIVYVRVAGDRGRNRAIVAALRSREVLCNAVGEDRMRFVTHHGIGHGEITATL